MGDMVGSAAEQHEIKIRNRFAGMVADGPGQDDWAVKRNSVTVAKRLGLSSPSETTISQIIVRDEEGEQKFEIGEGKYASAVFCQAILQGSGQTDFTFVPFALERLEEYMGATVMADARNPDLDNHGFVRALLSGKGTIIVEAISKII